MATQQPKFPTRETFLTNGCESITDASQHTTEPNCPICLDPYAKPPVTDTQSGDQATTVLIASCKHVFHHACLRVWLEDQNTCLVCRSSLFPRETDSGNTLNSIFATVADAINAVDAVRARALRLGERIQASQVENNEDFSDAEQQLARILEDLQELEERQRRLLELYRVD
ncbi:hypothetical protein BU26DRAFT_583757 [Trematosphaeria pertusa]|uniref:RING-type domain-containing protein n=1 Tax=Trematosphaeria pertusa TaxID=390896 RepID=A0A6A6IYX0_9PLEO|nr:uncharacterized protein BU26DRAFT_583757 [Trematosphaeria pertusa]KAF2255112.1 hypothetical protein BU26DRAFT_583757 [Trematosphaeria pertusa]